MKEIRCQVYVLCEQLFIMYLRKKTLAKNRNPFWVIGLMMHESQQSIPSKSMTRKQKNIL